jgi:hypothetical protein
MASAITGWLRSENNHFEVSIRCLEGVGFLSLYKGKHDQTRRRISLEAFSESLPDGGHER